MCRWVNGWAEAGTQTYFKTPRDAEPSVPLLHVARLYFPDFNLITSSEKAFWLSCHTHHSQNLTLCPGHLCRTHPNYINECLCNCFSLLSFLVGYKLHKGERSCQPWLLGSIRLPASTELDTVNHSSA